MSTHYYELKHPWSSIRCEDNAKHCKISVWESGALAGTLTVESKVRYDTLDCFFRTSPTNGVCVTTSRGDKGVGLTVHRIPRVDYLISEYGELCSFKELCRDADIIDERPEIAEYT